MSYIHVQNQNQLAPTPVVGQVCEIPTPEIIPVKINPSSTAYIQAGSALKYVTGASGEILVDAVTSITDGPVVGLLTYAIKGNKPVAGAHVEMAGPASYVWCVAGGVITRGQNVGAVIAVSGTTDPEVLATTTTGNYVIGTAIDEATAEGQMIRVRVAPTKL